MPSNRLAAQRFKSGSLPPIWRAGNSEALRLRTLTEQFQIYPYEFIFMNSGWCGHVYREACSGFALPPQNAVTKGFLKTVATLQKRDIFTYAMASSGTGWGQDLRTKTRKNQPNRCISNRKYQTADYCQ
jgi:hypothetical protein